MGTISPQMELISPAMSHAFSFKSGLLTLSLGFAAAFAVLTPAPEAQAGDGDGKVVCAKLKELKGFCDKHEGKRSAIGRIMKKAQKAYNKAHADSEIKCTTCHEKGDGTGTFNEAESKKYWTEFGALVKAEAEKPE